MKKLFFPLLFFAANLSSQAVHTYKGPEAWRDEDLSVPHRFVKVTLLEAVNVVQHKAPFLLSNNNTRKPVFLEKDRPVYVSLPAVIPIVRDTKIRVDTVDRIVYINRVDTVYRQVAMPGKIVYRDINILKKRDTVYIQQPAIVHYSGCSGVPVYWFIPFIAAIAGMLYYKFSER